MHDDTNHSSPALLPELVVCVVDVIDSNRIEQLLKAKAPDLTVQTFDDLARAEEALSKSLEEGDTLPSVIVTDGAGASLLDKFGPRFGLTLLIAYGGKTYPDEMVEAILKDKKKILPCAAYLQGEYGYDKLYVGVPVKLGRGGVEEIIEIKLTAEEKAALDKSADAVRELFGLLKTI